MFDHPVAGQDAGSELLNIKQGSRTVSAYAIEFRTLAARTGWEDSVLCCIFRGGLTEVMKDELVRDRPPDLNALVSLATDVDQRLRERKGAKALQHQETRSSRADSGTIRSSEASSSTPPREWSPWRWEGCVSWLLRRRAGDDAACAYTAAWMAISEMTVPSCQKTRLTRNQGTSGEPYLSFPHTR